eukprot:Protomagalhaensia_sp_Gyna_25__4147@NODE_375_length_3661_cov_554_673661_g287_i0_p2_GENE_NODE_375_length_3661_cov_554_673661_g287_i0NODE_375_length_3661_cov_554_673661_g287_i0_p2_ORF_typecomplete_len288_score28_76CBM_14/PF01607_24/9_5CBM_14/PF01607_24/0_72CBM_14/PF01607_24/1_5e03CBM_14/PF01607_24/6_6e02TIL/PF01826_17/2e02TIL/PF01826_17/74TIL/PF01826_17/3_2TIL/PF01826_17/2_4e02TIL/PF01826_17/3_5e02_NODE_375_length_3661_cov_554_673661_g287_i07441607
MTSFNVNCGHMRLPSQCVGECHIGHRFVTLSPMIYFHVSVHREGFEFSLKDHACVKTLMEPPSIECLSPGYQFDGRQCVSVEKSPVEYLCPGGTVLRGTVCISAEVVAGVFKCPNDSFVFDRGMGYCVGAEEVPVHLACPAGMVLDASSSRCVDTTSLVPPLSCPDKYQLDRLRNLCIKESVEQPRWQCSGVDIIMNGAIGKQAILMGDQCNVLVTLAPQAICPMDYTLNETTGMCTSIETRNMEEKCPFGFVPYQNKCLRQFQLNGMYRCPEGTFNAPRDESKCAS